jgi:carboxyl-terminal processing protease
MVVVIVMVFNGRTVLGFVLLAMFASSIVTITFFNPVVPVVNGNLDNSTKSGTPSTQAESLTAKDLKKLETTYNLIHSQYVSQIDHDKIVNGAINGMLSATEDPFSTYMTPEEAKQFQENVDALFEGIGVEPIIKDNKIAIDFLIKGSPAEKSGLRVNDFILSVNGEKLDGLTLFQAISKIRGKKGTQAELSIMRAGVINPINIIVVRDQIESQTVKGVMVTKAIGKIEIRQFSVRTVEEFKSELAGLEKQGMKGLIIDVRDDPGGLLKKVIDIATTFIEKGKTIVQTEDRAGKRQTTISNHTGPVRKYPIAVLINKGSASASEILAAALQQSAGCKLIGETTYGKGTVQEQFDAEMADGSNLKLTINKWLTPNGTWIHKKGIAPDIQVEEPAYFNVMPLSKKMTLKYDMNSEDVRNMQLMLEGLDFNPERKDGYYDAKTGLAVKAFQKANLLPETGDADAATMKELENKVILKIKDAKNDTQLNAAIAQIQNSITTP